MKKHGILVTAVIFMLLSVTVFSAGGRESAEASYTIEITGSTSVSPLMETLADAFSDQNPNVVIQVSGTGSGDGITGANTGVAELGMSSRNLRASELGFGLDVLTIAVDAIAVIVHPNNPVNDLSLEQIQGIYTGSITNWSELGGENRRISVVSREPGSGTRGAFEEVIGFVDELTPGAIEFDGTGGVKASVAGNVNAVGYISLGSLDQEVKAVSVGAVEPTGANVVNGTYEIARPFLVLYREDNIHHTTKQFLDWIMSAEGQAIAAKNYVPVR